MPRKNSQEIKSCENGLIKQNLFYLFFYFFVSRKNTTFMNYVFGKNFLLGKLNVDEEIYI